MNTKTYLWAAATLLTVLTGLTLILIIGDRTLPPPPPYTMPYVVPQETPPFADASLEFQPQQLVGTWRLEETSTPASPSGTGTRLKMFTGTHWCVIQPDETTGEIIFHHGGRYELDGGTMTTTVDFAGASTKARIGIKSMLTIQIEGDIMRQADSAGVFNETWKRVQ
jgi:hypothetical protein